MMMAEFRSLTVTLTPELAAFVERCVASGRFASPQDVIRKGIDLLRARERKQAEWAAGVRSAIEIGVEQAEAGQLTDGTEVFDELRRRARRN